MALRNPADTLRSTIQDNDHKVSLMNTRIHENNNTFVTLTKAIMDRIEQTNQELLNISGTLP
jgi:hypothetical protein